MPTLDTTGGDGLFKRNYSSGSKVLQVQQNLNAKVLQMFPVSPLKPSAQGIFCPVVMEGNEVGGGLFENEGFQDPDFIKPVQPSISSQTLYYPWQITGKTIRLSENDKVAFARGLHAQMEDTIGRAYADEARQAMGTGTAQMTLANGAGAASTTLTVDDPFPFRIGMRIDVWTAIAGTKEVNGVKVTAIDLANKQLTIGTASTWSDNSLVVKKAALDGVTATTPKEFMGIRGIVDTTTYSTTFQGQSVNTYPQWQGNVISESADNSVPVSQDVMQRGYNRTAIVSGKEPNLLISNYGQARTFLNDELQKTRYEAGEVKGGNTVLKWGTMTWLVNFRCPINEVMMLRKEGIERFQTKDLHLSSLPGNKYYQIVGRDSIGGYYIHEGNIGTWARFEQTRITGLSEPTI